LLSTNIKLQIYKTTRFLLFDVGLKSSLWEESRLRLFENRVLSKVLDTRRTQVTGDWRRLHNEDLLEFYSPNTSYYSGDKIRYKMGMARTTHMEKCAAKM
jgi:hypothetical protein